jgi:hypothetical protein
MLSDRLKSPIEKMIRAMLPLIDYQAWYRARVVSQSGDKKKVDLKPDDPRIPGVKAELMLGIPAATVAVNPGAFVLLGWKDGNPQFPVAKLWESGASITSMEIGSAADGVMTKQDGQALFNAISNAAVVAMDGGAAFKANILAALGTAGWSSMPGVTQLASTVVKVQRL